MQANTKMERTCTVTEEENEQMETGCYISHENVCLGWFVLQEVWVYKSICLLIFLPFTVEPGELFYIPKILCLPPLFGFRMNDSSVM